MLLKICINMANDYVSFVSDKDFLECVQRVCEAYPAQVERSEIQFLKETSVDPFKMIFDMGNSGFGTRTWIKNEKIRQADKTVNNRIGDFHQRLLGKVKGWEDLGIGHITELDLRKKDNSVFIELKNKYNTMNSSSLSKCHDKLEKVLEKFPNATAYWAYIVSKDGSSGEKVWVYNRQEEHFSDDRLRVIWGKEVYELITENPNALEETWKALPLAINEFIDSKIEYDGHDKKILAELSQYLFK